jgi:hypothetical protein
MKCPVALYRPASLPRVGIYFPIADWLWQSSGKVEKLSCVVLRLEALRGLVILVSSEFDLLVVFDVLCFFMGFYRRLSRH